MTPYIESNVTTAGIQKNVSFLQLSGFFKLVLEAELLTQLISIG